MCYKLGNVSLYLYILGMKTLSLDGFVCSLTIMVKESLPFKILAALGIYFSDKSFHIFLFIRSSGSFNVYSSNN